MFFKAKFVFVVSSNPFFVIPAHLVPVHREQAPAPFPLFCSTWPVPSPPCHTSWHHSLSPLVSILVSSIPILTNHCFHTCKHVRIRIYIWKGHTGFNSEIRSSHLVNLSSFARFPEHFSFISLDSQYKIPLVSLCHIFIIHLSLDGQLGWAHFLAIGNRAAFCVYV